MPYITHKSRQYIDHQLDPLLEIVPKLNEGELNYVVSRILNAHLTRRDTINYRHLNQIIGVLECAKQELYRRVAGPYEDKKKHENGDVYEVPQADGSPTQGIQREETTDVR